MAIVKMKRLQILALERDHDAMLRRLQHMGCVEISEPDTAALPRQADIIITAAGVRSSLTAAHVRPGQTVVDVSVNWDGSALCGDADFAAVEPVVDAITPVPGGVGAVTSSVLMAHTVRATELLTGEGCL